MAASEPRPANAFDRSLLRNPLFARLWFIQAATQVGGNMALYAMTILVFDTTQSTAAVSVLFATYVLPQIVLSPFAGVVVDRMDLRLALAGPNFVRAILMIGLALAGPQSADPPGPEPGGQLHERGPDARRRLDDPAGGPPCHSCPRRWASST